MSAFEVYPYTIDNLVQCFVDGSSLTSREDVIGKRHYIYFREYFAALGAATIVAEPDYIDRDYLEDYAAYYDRCFHSYDRRTQRLHFFKVAFDRGQFEQLLRDPNSALGLDVLREAYLGFVVVKPLPVTIIGRTCLQTYPSDEGRRQFPSLRTYRVNLYGLDLKVRSLAYQEQDTVVAACATSALWSCFQGTGKLFQHMIPPPVEITGWAGNHMPENLLVASARAFPNAGLTATQMAHAIRRVGLEPFVVGASTRYGLNGVMYAYLRGKIPSLLAAGLFSDYGTPQETRMGGHAMALTGFSLGDAIATPYGQTGFLLRANRIDKVYGHDDQVGPFARMVWEKVRPTWVNADGVQQFGEEVETLKTSWDGNIYANPDLILLPLYHKIRIPFVTIHDAMLGLDAVLEQARGRMQGQNRAEWDIFLTTASDYKSSVRKDYEGMDIDVMPSLLADLPRFLWRVIVRVDEKLELDFLFDATGIAQHDLLVHAVSAKQGYAQMLGVIAPFSDKISVPMQAKAVMRKFLVSPI
ncbi:hypothetical protein [Cupriavidus pauculus]|uniref:hypothetical protein n=1 Tax=Cupriavidus pauculus TaxID=82633 RepID=UPI000785C6B1|nr:hypothetical protein [Cupriavidus pauculus]